MYYGKRTLVLACVLTILSGVLLHFLYDRMPNAVTALFSPVSESIWEHTKLIYWPYLAAAALLNRGRPGGIYPWLLTLPLMCGMMLGMGYVYHVVLEGTELQVDIAIYVLVMVVGFCLPPRRSEPVTGVKRVIAPALTVALGVLIGVFTLWPPECILFEELEAIRTWFRIPC